MPKDKPTNALRQARKLLQIKFTHSSSDSSDTESVESNEYSHVPIQGVPEFNIAISEINMDQLSNQISQLADALNNMRELQAQQQQQLNSLLHQNPCTSGDTHVQVNAGTLQNFFSIPDPIKALSHFDASRKHQLTGWLTSAEATLNVFKPLVTAEQFDIYVSAVINKLDGRAKDIICLAGYPTDFNEVKSILINALGDRQELTFYKSQLWQTKMVDGMSIHKYYNKCKEITQSIKTLAKQKTIYKSNWDAINAFIDEDALAAFLAGLKEPYFGYAQAANPNDIEAAYAFVCKFKSRENTAAIMEGPSKQHFRKEYRNQENRAPMRKQFPENNYNKKPNDEKPQPMELGSVRSNLTLNKKQVYNTEITNTEESYNHDEEEIDLNFCLTRTNHEET